VVFFRSPISVAVVLGVLSASSLPCADLFAPSDRLQRVELARASGVHGELAAAMNATGHVHGVSAPARPRVESSVFSGGRDESARLTAPCLCGCQSSSSISSAPGTQLSIVALPSLPDLLAQSLFETRFANSSPLPTGRFPVPDWTPI